jgi:hypothetical protein
MGFKMLTAFMIRRSHNRTILLTAALGLSLLAVACQKVPLLAPSGSTLALTSSQTAIPRNGTAQLIAQLLEPAGTPPHSGTHVIFTTSLGSIEPSEVSTDINGRAVATFTAGGANGIAAISASSGGVSTGANPIRILVGTAGVGKVVVSANPVLIAAQGGTSVITATVSDINGNPLPSADVAFNTSAGSLDVAVATTDANGVATATLRTSVQADVTASVGAQAPTTGGGTTTPPATGGATTTPPASTGVAAGTIRVNVAGTPTLLITLPATVVAGVPASFTFAVTNATANASPIRDVTVDWGDGASQSLGAISGSQSASHTYQSPGSFTIKAVVTDSFGTSVPASAAVGVNPKPQPVVGLTAPTTTPTAGTDTVFTASVAPPANTGTVIKSVTIDYGDGIVNSLGAITGATIQLHHVYQSGGTYTVTLTATDSNDSVGTAATQVFVQPSTQLAVLLSATPTFGTTTTTESFTATVIGLGNAVVVSYVWNFGDGISASTTANQTTHQYAHPSGPFTVTVTITTSTGQTATGQTVVSP